MPIELFKDDYILDAMLVCGENDSSINIGGTAFPSDHVKEILDKGRNIPTAVAASESEWETTTSYVEHLMPSLTNQQAASPFNPELFRDAYSAIQKAGDQGLSMEELSQVGNMQGKNMPELIVEVLEAFGRALKLALPRFCHGDGTINKIVYKGLVRRVRGIVMQNPGILDDDIIIRMNVLNPQSCKNLLKLMIMDNHIIAWKMHQTMSSDPPTILGISFKKQTLTCR
ncbi:hypothetical protein ACSBR1_043634 [Camellia fascicularis]